MIKSWIEAMRLRTLPVSIAGVIAGTACAVYHNDFKFGPAFLCLLFAVLAQIASNFANEYFDYVKGLDKKGREGFRRGVTEGDISPKAMLVATIITLGLAAGIGLTLMFLYGTWWMLIIGVLIIIFALAYSTGPYPLSHHGLGDMAVILFFGVVPVTLTCMLQTGEYRFDVVTLSTSVAIGLMSANVLVVNNYRDCDDDKAVGKRTTVVIFGRRVMSNAYLWSGIIAMVIMLPLWLNSPWWLLLAPAVYLITHFALWQRLKTHSGAALNPILGKTAKALLMFSVLLLLLLTTVKFFLQIA